MLDETAVAQSTDAFNRRWLPRWLLAGAALALLGQCAAAEVAETLGRIYADHGLQDALPGNAPVAATGGGFVIPPHIVMWVLGTLVVALLAAWLIRGVDWGELRRRGSRAQGRSADGEQPGPVPRWFREADALARAGRYAQAVHALLLGVLAALTADGRWPRAATAREIAAGHANGSDLGRLVESAERAHSGGEPATEREYRAALARAARLCDGRAAADSLSPPRLDPNR